MPNPWIICFVGASLDLYISDPDGGVEWLNKFDTEDVDYGFGPFMSSIGNCVMGRTTYEHSRRYGPSPATKARKVVLTSREWPGDAPDDFETMCGSASKIATTLRTQAREAGGKARDIWLMGGGRVLADFLDAGEVDVLDIGIMPVLLGDGLPLFPRRAAPKDIGLIREETQSYRNGVVRVTYSVPRASSD